MPPLIFDDALHGQYLSGFVSKHFGGGDFNQNNLGFGYKSPDGYMFGGYQNSLNRPSLYAAKEFATDPANLGPVALRGALTAGLVTGYNKSVMPLLMPGATATMGDNTLALGVVPPVKGVTPLTLALQLRKSF